MGALDNLRRRSADAARTAAGSSGAVGNAGEIAMQRVRAAQRMLEMAREGVDPDDAVDLSVSAAVRQAATGQLPGDGNPATRVSVEAAMPRPTKWKAGEDGAWDPSARSGDVAPLLRAQSTPVAELVADDLEQILSDALPVEFDADAVPGVNEAAFESIQKRIAAVSSGSDTGREAVRILLARYGIPEDAPPAVLAERLAGGLAGQRLSGYEPAPRVVDQAEQRLQRIAKDPFPVRTSSLEGFPEASELFDPVEVRDEFRIPRFEYDQLGRLKVDADGNPVPRLDPEGGPTFETVSRRRLVPQRTVGGTSEIIPAGEFTTIGTRRSGSDGNRSAEEVAFVLDRGDGTYQLSTITEGGGYTNEIVGEGELGRLMVNSGYDRIAGPALQFTVKAPTAGEAESLGRMLFDSLQPGAATPQQLAEVVRRIDELGDVFDGALVDRALQAAGFQQPGSELAAGRLILDRAREVLAADPPAPPPVTARPQAPLAATVEVRPPAAFASRGSGVTDAAGDTVRQARGMLSTVSGPTQATVDSVAGPADASMFLGPDGAPITATGGPAFTVFGDAPPLSLYPPDGRKLREGRIGGTFDTGTAGGPLTSMSVGGDVGMGSAMDTGTLPGAVPVTTSSSVSAPGDLDMLAGLRVASSPATPVLNFEATPGSWADQTARGTLDVGGVDTVRALEPSDVELARQQSRELGNRQASVAAIVRQFPDREPTDDLAEIFRRMEEARATEPAFNDLDVAEQFEMASLGSDELMALADDLDAEAAASFNPNTFTQSASVAAPGGGSVFSTAQDLPPIQVALDRAGRVRQARDPSAPAPAPAADPSGVAFGIDRTGRAPSNRRDLEQRAAVLQARADANRRMEALLTEVENRYNPQPQRPGEAPPLPSTPEQVAQYVRGDGENFYRLPEAEKRAVLAAIESPNAVTELLDATIAQQRALRKELAGIAQPGRRVDEPDVADGTAIDTPDDVTDIPEQRASAEAELETSEANADFYNAQRNNAGAGRPLSLRRAQDIARRALGIKPGERLPLAVSAYDSRFGRRVSRNDIERLNAVRGYINKYESMSDAEYDQLRARNTDLPATRKENVDRLGAEFKKLARLIARDTFQDTDPSGVNQARLAQQLFSDDPLARTDAINQLFAVKGLRNAAGERIGEDGLQVIEMLARDPAYGSVENVLYDFLSRDPAINNPEAAVGRVVDERGAQATAAAMGPESLRQAARLLSEDAAFASGRRLTPEESARALLYQVREGDGLTPAFFPAPDAPADAPARPAFIDRLREYLPFLRRQADEAPAGPPEVRRQGLDTAEQEIAAATTPEEMNAVLARINRIEEQAFAQLDDANDTPAADGPLDDGGPRTVQGWAGPVEVAGRGPSGQVRSARQQIADRASELRDAWRRRMERMQAAGPPVVRAADEVVDDGPPVSAEEADALAIPGGESNDVPAALTKAQARADISTNRGRAGSRVSSESDDAPRFNPAGYTIVFRDPNALANLGVSERNRLVAEIDSRIAQAKADLVAGRKLATGSEIVPADTLASLQKERDRIATPKIEMLEDGRVSVQFAPGLDPLVGDLLRPVETDFGPVAPTFSGDNVVGVDFGPDGSPVIRKKGNVIDRRGQDVAFDPVPDVPRSTAAVVATPRLELPPGYRWSEEGVAAPAAAAASPAAAAARTDREILEEFARPTRQNDDPDVTPSAYDDDALEVSADEARIDADIESSLADPVPGPGRRRATEEYEDEQARKAGGGKKTDTPRKGGLTARRAATGLGVAGVVVGGGTAVNTGLNALVGAGVAGGLGFAPMASAYGESAPAGAEGDINTSAEPAGSQVRQARRRLSYLTSQNPLPY